MTTLDFAIRRGATTTPEAVVIDNLIIAGWTGRDQAALEHHIKELEALGVTRPATTPIFYRASATRLTHAAAIETTGAESSGEVEFVLVKHKGALFVGVGSDHTDRKVETYNVTVSKQMCEKPVASELWAFDDVAPHWDKLMLRSWACERTSRTLYQEGAVVAMRPPQELIARYAEGKDLADNTLMFCGTLAAQGGIRPAPHFKFELEDPVRGLKIGHGYDIKTLPVLG